MGVWIETETQRRIIMLHMVTPFVGVWIETQLWKYFNTQVLVTPFVGVWIETLDARVDLVTSQSHTLRGCVD